MEVEASNLPVPMRGVRASQNFEIPTIAFVIPLVIVVATYIFVQLGYLVKNRKRPQSKSRGEGGVGAHEEIQPEGVVVEPVKPVIRQADGTVIQTDARRVSKQHVDNPIHGRKASTDAGRAAVVPIPEEQPSNELVAASEGVKEFEP